MAIKTQGTELYFIDPYDDSVNKVGCVTGISGIDGQRDEIDVTCLDSPARVFEAGLINPGNATFNINFDTKDESHVRLEELYVAGDKLNWAIGWSDGTAAPTADSDGDVVAAAARSWITFNGYVSNLPDDFALNSVVTSQVSVKMSGLRQLIPATA